MCATRYSIKGLYQLILLFAGHTQSLRQSLRLYRVTRPAASAAKTQSVEAHIQCPLDGNAQAATINKLNKRSSVSTRESLWMQVTLE